jgi:hypothetical protein
MINVYDGMTGIATVREPNTVEAAELLKHASAEKQRTKTEGQRLATITAARKHALGLGFTEAMLAVMYPQLEGA